MKKEVSVIWPLCLGLWQGVCQGVYDGVELLTSWWLGRKEERERQRQRERERERERKITFRGPSNCEPINGLIPDEVRGLMIESHPQSPTSDHCSTSGQAFDT
jgi:hypothetical protein